MMPSLSTRKISSWEEITRYLGNLHSVFLIYPPLEKDVTYAITEYPDKGYQTKSKMRAWNWIRIKLAYDSSINQLTEDKKTTLKRLILTARNYFQKTLKVQPLYTLQLKPTCSGSNFMIIKGNGSYGCEKECDKLCGSIRPPGKAIYFANCSCEGGCITQRHWGGKLINTDFLLFVSFEQKKCKADSLAYAAHCSLDRKTNRPVAGYVNICPESFYGIKHYDMKKWIAVIKHELLHALVFSDTLFRKFITADQSFTDEGVIPGVVERIVREDWETASGFVQHEVHMIVTPRVREEARNYFNCPNLEGAELESQGEGSSIGSHWEKRVFENEAMSAVVTQVDAISRVTLALLEDSGWYQVNYYKAEEMDWGRGLGCVFAKRSCLTWMKSNRVNPYPFCTVRDEERCSNDKTAKLMCNLELEEKNNIIPPQYNYNIENLYRNEEGVQIFGVGGVEVADFCPYYQTYFDGVGVTICSSSRKYKNSSIEVYSPTARCFKIENGILLKNGSGSFTLFQNIGCFEAVCQGNQLYVKGQDTEIYACKRQGEIVRIVKYGPGRNKTTVPIVCPSRKEVCSEEISTISTSRRSTSRKPTFRRSTFRTSTSRPSVSRPSPPVPHGVSKLSKTSPTRSYYKFLLIPLYMLLFLFKFNSMPNATTF